LHDKRPLNIIDNVSKKGGRMENLEARGAQLIDELKAHIRRVVEVNLPDEDFSLGQIEQKSGLIIIGKTGQNVWDMAVSTLVIELVKDGVLRSNISIERLNTKSATQARFRLSR